MGDKEGKNNNIVKIILLLTIPLIGWNLYNGATIQEIGLPGFTFKFGNNVKEHAVSGNEIVGEVKKYLMDNHKHRVIVLTHINGQEYRIEETSSPWPWEGTAKLDGGKLTGEVNYRNSPASMRVEGVIRGDESIEVEYRFTKSSDGKLSNRIDSHVWYRSEL